MAEHTPGPWAVEPDERDGMEWNNHIVVASTPHLRICFMAHSGKDDNSEFDANAHLIAAAPDMLAALKDAEKRLQGAGMLGGTDDPVRTAIARTEGRAI